MKKFIIRALSAIIATTIIAGPLPAVGAEAPETHLDKIVSALQENAGSFMADEPMDIYTVRDVLNLPISSTGS